MQEEEAEEALMSLSREEQAIRRVAARHLASSEGQQFVRAVWQALDLLKDTIDVAGLRSSDNSEIGQSLADVDSTVGSVVQVIRDFTKKITPLLWRIR